MNDNRPIGVFDSGIGGVTVLSKLAEMLPNEDFIYVGDTLNCPYGVKTPQEIADLVTNVAKFLLKNDVKAIVIACNTATANSGHLKDITDVPVIGVIEPTANYAYKSSKNKNIAVLATNATIDSKKYEGYLEKRRLFKKGKRHYIKCSEFVPVVEGLKMGTEEARKIVSEKIECLKDIKIDTVILGCTHFGLLSKEILEILPKANLVGCGKPTGEKLITVLKESGKLGRTNKFGTIKMYTTGDPKSMEEQIVWFDKAYEPVKKIEI